VFRQRHPHIFEPLRPEVETVPGDEGLSPDGAPDVVYLVGAGVAWWMSSSFSHGRVIFR
jgi:hypothetical protein